MDSNTCALSLKDQAAEFFKAENYTESIQKYQEALEKIEQEDKILKS